MVTVISVEFGKQFGSVREKALKGPVVVTYHGCESLVVLSIEEFNRLKSLDTRQHYYAEDLPDDLAEALRQVKPGPESQRFAHEEP
jgi:PHD/YefM family antitoxin component YafN of YafNO toxin-antitoxin module